MRRAVLGVVLVVLAFVLPAAAGAAVKKHFVGRFNSPVQVAAPSWAPGSTIYIVEQAGRIVRRQKGGQRNVVLDIRSRVGFGGEQGLLSVAFGPRHHMWVYFTNNKGNLRIVRYTLNSGGGHVVNGSARTFFQAPHPVNSNHNGGTLQYRDGHLYLSTGDGGGGCDSHQNAQNLNSRLGKLLRHGSNGWKIVGYGLRNPWRWSFDRATGDLYIGDVGQDSREEVDFLPAAKVGLPAENYGWNHYEGTESGNCPGNDEGIQGSGELIFPKFEYGHGGSGPAGEVIVGGYVYRGRAMPGQRGRYFFADETQGWVRTADARTLKNRRTLGFTIPALDSFGENSNGELFAVSLNGPVFRLDDH
jgi:glucose/arabinose dehydrogenase